jgi:hypothetical protein
MASLSEPRRRRRRRRRRKVVIFISVIACHKFQWSYGAQNFACNIGSHHRQN